MLKVIIFIEPQNEKYFTPFKAGNLYMNRLAIEEDANVEIVKIFELQKLSWASFSKKGEQPKRTAFDEDVYKKGLSLIKIK